MMFLFVEARCPILFFEVTVCGLGITCPPFTSSVPHLGRGGFREGLSVFRPRTGNYFPWFNSSYCRTDNP